MYAVVQIAGRQYKVKQNDTIQVPTLDEKAGTNVKFDRVLLVGSEKQVELVVNGATFVKAADQFGVGQKH